MMQKFDVPLEPQASAVSALGRSVKTGGDAALAVGGERSACRPMRDDRPTQQELSVAVPVAARAELRFHEHGAVAIVFEMHAPERKGRRVRSRLAPVHDAGQIAQRIEVEEKRGGAIERRRRRGELRCRPHRAETP
jgi:hypothetical protein